ncbi:MAG TPA: hypothetical protein VGI47_01370 [Candidatus Binataceae bacterium]|jgi:hypothetical protein
MATRTIRIEVELPDDVFDHEYREASFVARARELAILELLRVRRLHEHEALALLGIERRELLGKMKEVGIAPTEQIFAAIKSELENAVESARGRRLSR